MKKTIERKIEWNLDEAGNHPPYTGWVMVQGKVVTNGTLHTDTRFVYHVKGEGYRENKDMHVIFWASYPETIC